ncbi:MAG: hypothetical protein IT569_03245 [Leptospiraceae bacterium]|nr:hypothetical protein [Leptospiraceae bacterium]
MKYYLSFHLVSDLIFSHEEKKKAIEEEIQRLIQSDARLFTSAGVIGEILRAEKNEKISPVFLRQIEILCDSIFPFEFEDCALAERLHAEYGIERNLLFEFAVCIRKNIDCFLTTREIQVQQNLLSVKRIAFKTE